MFGAFLTIKIISLWRLYCELSNLTISKQCLSHSHFFVLHVLEMQSELRWRLKLVLLKIFTNLLKWNWPGVILSWGKMLVEVLKRSQRLLEGPHGSRSASRFTESNPGQFHRRRTSLEAKRLHWIYLIGEIFPHPPVSYVVRRLSQSGRIEGSCPVSPPIRRCPGQVSRWFRNRYWRKNFLFFWGFWR